MGNVQYLEIKEDEQGQRLDNFLMRILKGVPKSHIYRLIRSGEVRINKGRAKPKSRLMPGDLVRIPPVRVSEAKNIQVNDFLNEKLLKSIIYEDEKFLVINKPAGIAVHGGSGLSLGIIEAFRKIRTDLKYLELVHRLDKETSGCLLLAKKRSVLREVQALFNARRIKKIYWTILLNKWQGSKQKVVDIALEKNILKSGERVVKANEQGKSSQTTFRLITNFKHACFVEAYPKTGRTHQIRVHSAFIDHPVVGDKKYGKDVKLLNKKRLYLHARKISFKLGEKEYCFEAKLDDIFNDALNILDNKEPK